MKFRYGSWILVAILPWSLTEISAGCTQAVVDMTGILRHSPQHSTILRRLGDEFKGQLDEIRSIEQTIQDTVRRLQGDDSTLRSGERNLLEKTLTSQRTLLLRKIQSFERRYRQRQEEERKEIDNSIRKVVRGIALENGYEMVLDAGVVIYSAEVVDISDEVVRRLHR